MTRVWNTVHDIRYTWLRKFGELVGYFFVRHNGGNKCTPLTEYFHYIYVGSNLSIMYSFTSELGSSKPMAETQELSIPYDCGKEFFKFSQHNKSYGNQRS